jgi:hypothetical protein
LNLNYEMDQFQIESSPLPLPIYCILGQRYKLASCCPVCMPCISFVTMLKMQKVTYFVLKNQQEAENLIIDNQEQSNFKHYTVDVFAVAGATTAAQIANAL